MEAKAAVARTAKSGGLLKDGRLEQTCENIGTARNLPTAGEKRKKNNNYFLRI